MRGDLDVPGTNVAEVSYVRPILNSGGTSWTGTAASRASDNEGGGDGQDGVQHAWVR